MSETKLVLIGRSGNGITSVLNSILENDNTDQTHSHNFNVIEIKGIEDSDVEDIKTFREHVFRTVNNENGLIHAIVFVLKYGVRFTKQEKDAVRLVKTCFGEDAFKACGIIAFSYGDNFRSDNSVRKNDTEDYFRDWCQKQEGDIKKLFEEVEYRCVLFDNKTKDNETKSCQKGNFSKKVELALEKNNCLIISNLLRKDEEERGNLKNKYMDEKKALKDKYKKDKIALRTKDKNDKSQEKNKFKNEKRVLKNKYREEKMTLRDKYKKDKKALRTENKKNKKALKIKYKNDKKSLKDIYIDEKKKRNNKYEEDKKALGNEDKNDIKALKKLKKKDMKARDIEYRIKKKVLKDKYDDDQKKTDRYKKDKKH